MNRSGLVAGLVAAILMTGAIALGCFAGIPLASAQPLASGGGSSAFCSDVHSFDVAWPQVNLDVPHQPFFSDGNNDGIADFLQLHHAELPQLGSQLAILASYASSAELRTRMGTMASDAGALAKEPAPVTAAQSSQEAAPIERVAAAVQPTLKAKCPLPKNLYAASANSTGQTAGDTSGSSDQGKTAAVVAVFLLLNLPIIRRIWRYRQAPHLRADGSGFAGNLRRWKVETITGQVLNVERESVITGGGHSANGGFLRVTTTVYETIRLALGDGRQRDVQLTNFMASPHKGDVLTVCVGRKGSRSTTFAVLNHTTGQQTVHPQNVFGFREGGTWRQLIFLMGLIFGSLISMFIAVFGGAPWLIVVWFALLLTFGLLARRSGRISDMQPLWNRSRAEASPLLV
jgi:hypothetical protein